MPSVTLDAGDAAELAEILTFIGEWLARDTRLEASLADQIGHPAYGIQHLRDDLDRFTFLLGGSDGGQEGEATTTSPAKGGPTTTDQPAQ